MHILIVANDTEINSDEVFHSISKYAATLPVVTAKLKLPKSAKVKFPS